MMTMNELVDLRMQQHIAHEIYRQQIMQRIPDPFPHMLPIPLPRHVIMPPRITLPGVDVTLQNDELWKQFHQIGTEMIITKSGRRMFPSMRLTLAGLEDESNYCVLLEMVPIGDCRFKFSGSQWVPAGGAEPQSPQRMYLHPDSPASGAHWQAQPILFNKVKLTNNTLDSSGHIVLASMHKYQPRIHVIRTADLTQIPWAPQQAFVFPETEFVAVTAYQNDRITKLKIDNNPFAKGFRETGQSRSKRKMSSSPSDEDQEQQQQPQQQNTVKQCHIKQLQQKQQQHQHQQRQQQHSNPSQHSHSQRSIISPAKSTLAAISDSGSSICSDKPPRLHDNETETENDNNDNDNDNDHDNSDDNVDVDVDIVASADAAVATDDRDGDDADVRQIKRMRSNGSGHSIASPTQDDYQTSAASDYGSAGGSTTCAHFLPALLSATDETSLPHAPLLDWPLTNDAATTAAACAGATQQHATFVQHLQQNMQSLLRPSLVDLACTYFGRAPPHAPSLAPLPPPIYATHLYAPHVTMEAQHALGALPPLQEHLPPLHLPPFVELPSSRVGVVVGASSLDDEEQDETEVAEVETPMLEVDNSTQPPPAKRKGFSISAILGNGSS